MNTQDLFADHGTPGNAFNGEFSPANEPHESRLDLFTALGPTDSYPRSPLRLTVLDVEYHLPLAMEVADALPVALAKPSNGFRRVVDLCNPEQVRFFRNKPNSSWGDMIGHPAFAVSKESVYLFSNDQDDLSGIARRYIFANQEAAEKLLRMAHDSGALDAELSEYLLHREAYFRECGGFELLCLYFYFDGVDQNKDRTSNCPVLEQPRPRTREGKTRLLSLGPF